MISPNPQLERLRDLPSFLYLGSPYSKYAGGLELATQHAQIAAAHLMCLGFPIFSPIAHSHGIGVAGELDNMDWTFWRRQDQPLMDAASAMIVVKMPGWKESVGLRDEIAEFKRFAKPIVYLEPEEVGL